MRKLTLTRDQIQPDCITGIIVVNDAEFFTLELPDLDNQRNVSCVPCGTYRCEFLPRAGKRKNVYWVRDVPNRDQILIHVGNISCDTHGCILIGNARGKNCVVNSRIALAEFVALMKRKPFELTIQYQPEREIREIA